MVQFRVVDLLTADRNGDGDVVAAESPERAAQMVLGIELVRDGKQGSARALVYFEEHDGRGSSVRLFSQRKSVPDAE
jgi:hypothetical protein